MKNVLPTVAGAALALCCAVSGASATTPTQIAYDIFDGDKPVGHLDVTLTANGNDLVVAQRAEITLRRMMLTAKVHQSVDEHWQGERLLTLRADTTSELAVASARKTLSVVRDAAGTLRATAGKTTRDLPADALPLTTWSARTLVPGPHFELGDATMSAITVSSSTEPAESVRYLDDECRRSIFESDNGSKRSVITAWIGRDEIVCKLRIRSGDDVLTYTRRASP